MTQKRNTLLLALIFIFVFGMVSCQDVSSRQEADVPYAKNIIYFVGDGMGYNQVLAANYFEYGEAGVQPYEQDDWLHLGLATYMAARMHGDDTIYMNAYAPGKAWVDADYLFRDATDSGAAATALSTGRKVMNGSIGIDLCGDTLTHISQAAKNLGKSIGVVSSVPFSHATPAGFAAHNHTRGNLAEIARYMLFSTQLDVIMAPGHPYYNNDGIMEELSYNWVGGKESWDQLTVNEGRTVFAVGQQQYYAQDVDGDGERDPWTFIEERADFAALATGPAPKRVFGVPRVHSTLNQGRSGSDEQEKPFSLPLNENVPTLEEMTRASLNVLGQNKDGFFVMVEGGAIDWAGHGNNLVRLIEEQIDFNNSVRAAIEWVEENSSWEETLIIVTSDHETGFLTGPDHPETVNDPVVNRGQGQLPEVQWQSGGHTNMLVPFYAKGPGRELFTLFAGEKDPVIGPYLQNTDVANAIFLMWGKPDIDVYRLGE